MKKYFQYIISLTFILFLTVSADSGMHRFKQIETNVEVVEVEIEEENYSDFNNKTAETYSISDGDNFDTFSKAFFQTNTFSLFKNLAFGNYTYSCATASKHLAPKYILNCSLIFYA